MGDPISLSKADVGRAMVLHHFSTCENLQAAFDKLRSVQFDPIAPVGCNHDLVLQARVPGYKIGDWNKFAYEDRKIYDGWDKQASLVPIEGWPLRRVIHSAHRKWFEKKIFEDYKSAVDCVLKEITEHGPMMPKQFDFQMHKEEWKGSWHGPSLTKQTLRALWHSGLIMTSGRKNGQHLYDLTERVLPEHLYNMPQIPEKDAFQELIMERHSATGILRPTASYEIWALQELYKARKEGMTELLKKGKIIPVDVEGMKTHATPDFLTLLDNKPFDPKVVFIAPLDQFIWDRKMISHVFGFDYTWEIYTPEVKRKWGYYVLPVLFGNKLVARAEFWCRNGILELREWHFESEELSSKFWSELEIAIMKFMHYSASTETKVRDHIIGRVKEIFLGSGRCSS